MKMKILAGASAAALLIAGQALAAGSTVGETYAAAASSVNQTGDHNNAYVDQVNNDAGDTLSVVNQGFGNSATTGGIAAHNNTARVTQYGTTNARAVTYQANLAGPTNVSGFDSVDNYSDGFITDKYAYGNLVSGPGNNGQAFTAATNAKLSTTGQTLYTGEYLAVDSWVLWNDFASFTVNSPAAQLAAQTAPYGNQSIIYQAGKNPDALAYQVGNQNTSVIQQAGTGVAGRLNLGAVLGNDGGSNGAVSSFVSAAESANPQYAVAGIGGAAVVQDQALGNSAVISQANNNNGARIVQFNQASSYANVTQNGTNDKAFASQRFGNNNLVSVYQASNSTDATAFVDQNGADHSTAAIGQAGATELAGIYQTASNDYSSINQGFSAGSGNTAYNAQTLNNAWSSITQNGTGNTAVVNQLAGTGLHFTHN